MKDPHATVGSKIRAYRKARKLSLAELSRRTGVAASNLSAIELNKSSPTLGTLVKIAEAFGMRIGPFLDGVLYSKAVMCPKMDREEGRGGSSEPQIFPLTSQVAFNRMEACLMEFETGLTDIAVAEPGADRLIYCLEGELKAEVDDQVYLLGPGDSLYLLPEALATIEATGGRMASALVVRTPAWERTSEA